jgi:predicted RNA-binding protein with PIN domain
VIGLQTGFSIKNHSKNSVLAFVIGSFMSLSGVAVMLLLSLIDKSINYTFLLGILCGALTSTPGLSNVCERMGNGSENAVMEREAYKPPEKVVYTGSYEDDKELMAIFERTYGKIKERKAPEKVENKAKTEKEPIRKKQKQRGDSYVIVDGYNFIFANDATRRLAEMEISLARDALIRAMCDYSAFTRCKAIIVFDAYKRKGGDGSCEKVGDVTVIYTKESQTADSYIERATYDIAKEHNVRVVTSDFEEQLVILGAGGLRVSAKEFFDELTALNEDISAYF